MKKKDELYPSSRVYASRINKKDIIRSAISLALLLLFIIPLFFLTKELNNDKDTDKSLPVNGESGLYSDAESESEPDPDNTASEETGENSDEYELPIVPVG